MAEAKRLGQASEEPKSIREVLNETLSPENQLLLEGVAHADLPLSWEQHRFLQRQLQNLGMEYANAFLAVLNMTPKTILDMTVEDINDFMDALDEHGAFHTPG